jgi:hypothetical protein
MTVAWLTIALFTPVTILSFSGQVLCIGEDSHLQVESTSDSCCGFGVTHVDTSNLMGDNHNQHGCGDCNDMDLDRVSHMRILSRSADQLEAGVLTSLAWSITTTPSTNCMAIQIRLNEYSPAFTQPLLLVSTTILIC